MFETQFQYHCVEVKPRGHSTIFMAFFSVPHWLWSDRRRAFICHVRRRIQFYVIKINDFVFLIGLPIAFLSHFTYFISARRNIVKAVTTWFNNFRNLNYFTRFMRICGTIIDVQLLSYFFRYLPTFKRKNRKFFHLKTAAITSIRETILDF